MAAATQTVPALLTMEEYLRTSYDPDRDFVDGAIEERHVGEYEHNNLQAALIAWFFNRGPQWNIRVLPEQRTRTGETTVRIPDVCIIPRNGPVEKVRTTPPILCIEIMSPEDQRSRAVRVLNDYLAMGVANLWLFDPIDRTVFLYDHGGLTLVETSRLTIPGHPIYLDLPELFATLD